MSAIALFQKVDAVTISVPDLDAGLRFYRDSLRHQLRWHNEDISQAGLALPGGDTEIVLTTRPGYEPNWLVTTADHAAAAVQAAGGRIETGPVNIPAGRVAVVAGPFGNILVLIDVSKGHYVTDAGETSPRWPASRQRFPRPPAATAPACGQFAGVTAGSRTCR
jgi:predicted enzyme related to lactoylglutathione lyase